MPALCRAPRCRSICRRSRDCHIKPLCHPEGSEAESRDLLLIAALGEPLRSLHSRCSVGMTEKICGLPVFPSSGTAYAAPPSPWGRLFLLAPTGGGLIGLGDGGPPCALVFGLQIHFPAGGKSVGYSVAGLLELQDREPSTCPHPRSYCITSYMQELCAVHIPLGQFENG